MRSLFHSFISSTSYLFVLLLFICGHAKAEVLVSDGLRSERLLTDGWRFHLGDMGNAERADADDGSWEEVTVPHDWAINGPFGRKWDIQNVAILQNGENEASWHTGRTGGLPYIGVGWYRRHFNVEKGHEATLLFDGAMSEAHVYVNGKEAIFWPYGYNSFFVDITPYLNSEGGDNVLAVRLENRDNSSRWYPGAGIYRNVHLLTSPKFYIPVWGVQVTTPHVEADYAVVNLKYTIEGAEGKEVELETTLVEDMQTKAGSEVAKKVTKLKAGQGRTMEQNILVEHPKLWSPEHPSLYMAQTKVKIDGQEVDLHTERFGIRKIEYISEKGFYLNGQHRKFQGVCLHHDLGPLGAAVNRSAIRHQLSLLKEMGCDAIRTSHNMPAPELVELCDEMGFMMMVEPFDEWDVAKCANGYHRYFKEWAERDMVNMVRHYRNNPSVVMWSIGNEVPTQGSPDGWKVAAFLRDICHREDPTRPVTCGMDQVETSIANGFAAVLDIPGFNYRTNLYEAAYKTLSHGIVLGSETASTVSSRGVYKFPLVIKDRPNYPDHQTSAYDMDYCWWSNLPEVDFALADDYPWTIGQFVWTGFDYLGEPTPYDTEGWPSHSSLFGIIDLASLPKDRYYLYQSQWRPTGQMLHVLPHWTWPGREGEVTPVMAYTNLSEAVLYVNGRMIGKARKLSKEESEKARQAGDPLWLQRRYRLIWDDVRYEAGEIRVDGLDRNGNVVESVTVRTAGKPHHLVLTTDRESLLADGEDLAYITVSVVDKDGNVCPNANNLVNFSVKGAGRFRAAANGDPTNLDIFSEPRHHAFAGQLTAIVQAGTSEGIVEIQARSGSLKGSLKLKTLKN